MRKHFIQSTTFLVVALAITAAFHSWALWALGAIAPVVLLGIHDLFQKKHSVLRNFPVLGHFRFLLEDIRPEINQYFVESNTDGVPFSREQRSIIYQRAKHVLDTIPFGTQKNVYDVGYEWINHSIAPTHVTPESLRVTIGGPDCKQPYSASILNISAMSYGSLSKNAVMALNGAAKLGNFSHNTGEGGLTKYHLQPGGDIVWQLGTAYFGARDENGNFDATKFEKKANQPQVKMIEIKLSQGAKPGHGGILPAKKVSAEIAEIRDVPMGKDVISPPGHTAFSTPLELCAFVARLRKLSSGKPIGLKLCLGRRREFIALCKAMNQTGIAPDYITVDGGEGGTGAAPLEFSNHVGTPLREGLIFVHNALVGYGLRNRVRVIASGKITSGFDLLAKIAIGADACNSARAMMMALGCIQALRCNSNTCPVGVATQDPTLVAGLDVADKRVRVASFHRETVSSFADLLGAMGLSSANELRPWHLMRRTAATEVKHYGDLYRFLKPGELLNEPIPEDYRRACEAATANSFRAISGD